MTVTERMGTSRPANSRGTNAAPSATAKVTAPSWTAASISKRAASSSIARASSSVVIWTRSLPMAALRAAGVPRATMRPWSTMAMRSQCSASSM